MSIPKSRGNVTVKNSKKISKAVKQHQKRLTAEERVEFASRRRLLVGSLITQAGIFEGAMVLDHVRGSQYLVRLVEGEEVYASHKRAKDVIKESDGVAVTTGFSHGGWVIWK